MTAGLAFVPVSEGYVVDGGPRRELLVGRAARLLFPVLLPLLDGTRTVDQIAAELGIPSANLHPFVTALAERDLIRFHEISSDNPLRTYLERSFPANRADSIWRRLQNSTATVTKDHPLRDLLADLLRESGIGTVHSEPGSSSLSTPSLPESGPKGSWLANAGLTDAGLTDAGLAGAGLAGVAAGIVAGRAVRKLGGYDDEVDEPTGGAKRYLTERRLAARRSPDPLLRRLADHHHAPSAAPATALRVYLHHDRTYFIDALARELVELAIPQPSGLGTSATWHGPTVVITQAMVGARPVVKTQSVVGARPVVKTQSVVGAQAVAKTQACGAAGGGMLSGDVGVKVAEIAESVRCAGWRATQARVPLPDERADLSEHLDLDPDRERIAAVVTLAPAPRAGRVRRLPMTYGFADEPLAGSHLARLVSRTLNRVEEICPGPPLRTLLHARRVTGAPPGDSAAVEEYLTDRGLSPAAVLLFATEGGDFPLMKAGLAAGTLRLLSGRSGIAAGLLARFPNSTLPDGALPDGALPDGTPPDGALPDGTLPSRAPSGRSLYGCALGYPVGPSSVRISR